MQFRTLGKTGLEVSILGYGASPLGGVFGAINENEGIATVHRALDLGVNFVDVSPFYGETKAETVLGRALQTVPRHSYYLATKVGRYGQDQFDFSAARVTRSVDESLKRLGVEYLDIIQCHDIEFVALDQIVDETLPALRRVVETGKARFVGITGLPLKIFREVTRRAEVDTILSYCHYTLTDTSLLALLPMLKARDLGVINAAPLGMGLLTAGAPDWHPAPPEIRQACARAAALCESRNSSLTKLAIQFAVANSDIATTLVGAAQPRYIEENVRWSQEPIDLELLASVQEILAPIHNQSWPSGLAQNQGD